MNGGDQAALNPSLTPPPKKAGAAFLTQESVGNVLGHLVAGAAHLGQVGELPVQHPLELRGGEHRKMAFLWNPVPNAHSPGWEAPPARRIPGMFGMESATDGFISILLSITMTGYFFSAHGINFL